MDFLELAKGRCSMRAYQDKKVEVEKISKILEAGRIAPTAANCQPQKFLVINEEQGLQNLSKGVGFHDAPLAIIVCADTTSSWVRPYDQKSMADIDGTIVADHMVMEAESLGLGTCWLTYFQPQVIKQAFSIPSNYEVIAILSMGYAAAKKSSPERYVKERHPIETMVTYNSF